MALSKIRDGSKSVLEVTSARSRLDNALQELVQRKGDSADEEPLVPLEEEPCVTPPFSPAKKSEGKCSARKRRRKDDELETSTGSESPRAYIVKLFDRSIDLAQFTEQTNLYPLCRAWLKNDPDCRYPPAKMQASPDHPTPTNGDQADVFHLPDPDEPTQDLRVPPPIAQTDEILNIHADPGYATPPEELLLKHMARWKLIRNSWLEASRRHDSQYSKSLALLKSMYDAQMKDNL